MQVNANSIRSTVANGITSETPKPPTQSASSAQSFEATATLNDALKNTPDVRRDEVERATRLVETGGYPPPELINRLSRLLADVVGHTEV